MQQPLRTERQQEQQWKLSPVEVYRQYFLPYMCHREGKSPTEISGLQGRDLVGFQAQWAQLEPPAQRRYVEQWKTALHCKRMEDEKQNSDASFVCEIRVKLSDTLASMPLESERIRLLDALAAPALQKLKALEDKKTSLLQDTKPLLIQHILDINGLLETLEPFLASPCRDLLNGEQDCIRKLLNDLQEWKRLLRQKVGK